MPGDDKNNTPTMLQVRDAMIRMEERSGAVMKILDEDVKPVLRALPDTITQAIARHTADCPARSVFIAKAAAPSNPPRPVHEDDSNGLSLPKIPPRLIYFFIGIGVVATTIILGLKYFIL